ncbi:MAG: PAS domain-containing protein [Pseudomonadota bacterium]|nr:PAS domain-containing protein [Pseudomonadota bacterium]
MVDSALWPMALTRLADAMGTAQIGLLTLDRRARTYESLAPRTDPIMDAIFKKYWAFHNPLWPRTIARPAGEVFWLDSLIPRKDFVATRFFNEWMRPAEFGIASMGANLLAGNKASTMISVANAPGKDEITGEQTLVFKAALQHIDRAVRIHRELRMRDLDHDTAPDRLEHLRSGVMLVDGAAKVLFANATARALLNSTGGLALEAGCLRSTDGSDALQRFIASCKRKAHTRNDPGGEISIRRGPRRSLRVTVTPLRARGSVAELPWLGLQLPVAIVTVSTPAMEK